jgi:hypothetical protein
MAIRSKLLKQYRLVLTCLGLSVAAWFLVQMLKDYTQVYHYRLLFVDGAQKQQITAQSDSLLVVEVSTKGIYLIPFELMANTLDIDCRQLFPQQEHLPAQMRVNEKQLRKYLMQYYGFSENFRMLSPAAVRLKIE